MICNFHEFVFCDIPRKSLVVLMSFYMYGYKICSHFVWYDEEVSQISKEWICSLHEKLNQENFNVNDAIIKEEELKLHIKFLKMMNKFTMAMTFVLLIGLVVLNVIN